MIERLAAGWSVTATPRAMGTTARTVRKWRDRFAAAEAEIEVLRRGRLSGPAIARQLGRPVSTVGVALRCLGLGRLIALDRPR